MVLNHKYEALITRIESTIGPCAEYDRVTLMIPRQKDGSRIVDIDLILQCGRYLDISFTRYAIRHSGEFVTELTIEPKVKLSSGDIIMENNDERE
ncbi:MAG: hypothetical protein J6W74_00255 [Bacteroidales bacterium]|nr:hypothetical protein [Bacteroidales bacterium]MBP5689326.1 hypothetical protein [Bacteroidales bacterium]